jgi:hypothetical protein
MSKCNHGWSPVTTECFFCVVEERDALRLKVSRLEIESRDARCELMKYRGTLGNPHRNYVKECNILLSSKNNLIDDLRRSLDAAIKELERSGHSPDCQNDCDMCKFIESLMVK